MLAEADAYGPRDEVEPEAETRVDGAVKGCIFCPPYLVALGALPEGKHEVCDRHKHPGQTRKRTVEGLWAVVGREAPVLAPAEAKPTPRPSQALLRGERRH